MKIKAKIKQIISFLLHGERPYVIAKISVLKPNKRLWGGKIIVTGGSRGLGYSMAKKFVEEGAEVLITGRNEETLKQAASDIKCKYMVLDSQNVSSFQSLIERACQELGGLTGLVNNAGVSLHEQDFFHITQESFDSRLIRI